MFLLSDLWKTMGFQFISFQIKHIFYFSGTSRIRVLYLIIMLKYIKYILED